MAMASLRVDRITSQDDAGPLLASPWRQRTVCSRISPINSCRAPAAVRTISGASFGERLTDLQMAERSWAFGAVATFMEGGRLLCSISAGVAAAAPAIGLE